MGNRGVAAVGNLPPAAHAGYMWPHAVAGRLWIMGGEDDQANTNGHGIYCGLWSLDASTAEWAWEAGPATHPDQPGKWSGGGEHAHPGARYAGSSWSVSTAAIGGGDGDRGEELWLFGGWGVDAAGKRGYLSDVWRYTIN